jgi:hypothetical protein
MLSFILLGKWLGGVAVYVVLSVVISLSFVLCIMRWKYGNDDSPGLGILMFLELVHVFITCMFLGIIYASALAKPKKVWERLESLAAFLPKLHSWSAQFHSSLGFPRIAVTGFQKSICDLSLHLHNACSSDRLLCIGYSGQNQSLVTQAGTVTLVHTSVRGTYTF